ncbi:MAG: DMT family transporter [Pseudomonadota bacterium]
MTPTSRAILIMICASALIAATSLFAKALGTPTGATEALHALQVSAGRFGFALLGLLAFVTILPTARPSFQGAHWRWHITRTSCGWLGITCMFAAVASMPVAEATAISFLSPPIAMILAMFMLGEAFTARKLLAVILAATGAALILRPGSDAFQTAGLYALAAAVFMAFETMFIKRLSDSEPALRILIVNNALGACISIVVASAVWSSPSAQQWVLLILLGLIMVSGQALFIQSMKRAPASTLMPAFYSILVFAALYDWALNGVFPSNIAVLGGALIITGALVLTKNGAPLRARRLS